MNEKESVSVRQLTETELKSIYYQDNTGSGRHLPRLGPGPGRTPLSSIGPRPNRQDTGPGVSLRVIPALSAEPLGDGAAGREELERGPPPLPSLPGALASWRARLRVATVNARTQEATEDRE